MNATPPDGPSPASAAPAPRPLADWARAADGIQLAGIAVFLLLNTSGVLPWTFWLDALALWPVLVMSAGIKIAFEKTRAPWLLLLGPALVLGSLAWAASGQSPDVAGPWTRDPIARPAEIARLKLETHLAGSRLAVEAREIDPALLVDARWSSRSAPGRFEVSSSGDLATAKLKGGWKKGPVILPGRRLRWELGVPSELPLEFALHGAMVRGQLDLERSRLQKAALRGVFLGVDLALPAPEEPSTLRLNGVFNMLEVTVPEGTPLKVSGAGLPFNLITRRLEGAPGRPGYEIRVDGIFTIVTLATRPTPTTPPPPASARPKPEAEPTPRG